MKNALNLLAVLVVVMGISGICAYAQAPPAPAANVNGSVSANTALTFGDPGTAGGFNNGQGLFIFNVADPTTATANANVSVAGSGVVTPGQNSLASASLFSGLGAISIDGNPSNFTVFGTGVQSNWATLSSPSVISGIQNFATAGGLTNAQLMGTLSNPNPDSAAGQLAINANGNSAVTFIQTPSSVQTTAMTQGGSLVGMTLTGTNAAISPFTGMATGSGMVGAQGMVQDPTGSMFAGSSMQGIAGFNIPAALTSSIGGSFRLNGATGASYGTGNVQASASVSATSTTSH